MHSSRAPDRCTARDDASLLPDLVLLERTGASRCVDNPPESAQTCSGSAQNEACDKCWDDEQERSAHVQFQGRFDGPVKAQRRLRASGLGEI